MEKKCLISQQNFQIASQEEEFIEKMKLPLPQIHPKYREIMRLAFRNDRNLFKRKCDFSNKEIISVYRKNAIYQVYDVDVWKGFDWTPPYLDCDPDKDIFQQYFELQKITPRVSLFSIYNENCEYVNAAEKNKDCYMIFVTDRCRDCYYLDTSYNCNDCADCSYCYNCQLCFQSCDLQSCYFARYSYLCDNSSDIAFCFDLKGCRNCLFCSGLRDQQYCILNKQLSPEEYKRRLAELDFSSYHVSEELKQKFFREIMPPSYSKTINCEDCSGNFLINCQNCQDCFTCEAAQDCRRVRAGANGIKDVYDSYAVVDGSELIYNNVSTTESYNCHNVIGCWTTKDSCYSEYLQGCRDCMFSISLKKKQYCILNKQYSRDDYFRLKKQIIHRLGEYYGNNFPLYLAPFSYQDSVYKDYYSLSQTEVEAIGWRWDDAPDEKQIADNFESARQLPDRIDDFNDADCKRVFSCLTSDKLYKIVPQELRLLKKLQVPLPRKQHDQRFLERVRFRKLMGG